MINQENKPTLKDYYQAYKEIDGKLFKWTFWTALLIIILAILLIDFIAPLLTNSPTHELNYNKSNTLFSALKSISLICIGIATSVTAATLLEIFIQMRERLEREFSKRKFRDLFSFIQNPSKEVAIVIPRFPIEKLSDQVKQGSETEVENKLRYSKKILTKGGVLSYPDIFATTDIVAAFAEQGFSLPQIRTDENIEDLLSSSSNFKTIIAIGLYTNEFTMWVDKTSQSCPISLFEINAERKEVRIARREEGKIANLSKWRAFSNNENEGFALIAKMKLKNGKTGVVIGGIGGDQTIKIGRYIQTNWRDIYKWHYEYTQRETLSKCFAGIIEFLGENDVSKRDLIDSE